MSGRLSETIEKVCAFYFLGGEISNLERLTENIDAWVYNIELHNKAQEYANIAFGMREVNGEEIAVTN